MKRERAVFARAVVVAAAIVFSAGVQASYVVTPFDLPGSLESDIWGINDAGYLVGSAGDGQTGFGYVYGGGKVVRLDGPAGSLGAGATGISAAGAVVGSWTDSTRPRQEVIYDWDPVTGTQIPRTVTVYAQRGFVWQAGSYTAIDVPFAGALDTTARAISPDGRYVSGTYNDASSTFNSFVLDTKTGAYTDLPAVQGYNIAQGINSAGQMVGDRTTRSQGYIMDLATGNRTDFSFSGVTRLAPRAINDRGQMAGWLSDAAGTHAWIGNASGYQKIDAPAAWGSGALIGEGLNNHGQVVGPWDDAARNTHGFIATPAVDPVDTSVAGVYTFSTAVVADVPIFIDPKVAVGYDYQIGAGDPLFKTVSLPAGVGGGNFEIVVGGQTFAVGGNQIFDFTANGFAQGVAEFKVTGIEPSAMLEPNDYTAFVTRLTFMGNGMFTGSQTALTADYTPPVPEPASWALWLGGLAGVGWGLRRRPRF